MGFKDFIDLWNIFSKKFFKNMEKVIDFVHLESITKVDQVPVKNI